MATTYGPEVKCSEGEGSYSSYQESPSSKFLFRKSGSRHPQRSCMAQGVGCGGCENALLQGL